MYKLLVNLLSKVSGGDISGVSPKKDRLYVTSYAPGLKLSIPVKLTVIKLWLIVKFDWSRDILRLLLKQSFNLRLECTTSGML